MKRIFLAAGLLALAAPVQAQADPDVQAGRAGGVVGERYDGYLGLSASASDNLRKRVGAVNLRRRTLYFDLASRRGVSPQEVGITAGCELLARVGPGEAYLLADNVWRRRAAGQGAPKPDYCG